MSCNQSEKFAESVNEVREEQGLEPLTLSQALELAWTKPEDTTVELPESILKNYVL